MESSTQAQSGTGMLKFIIGGLLILAAAIYLIWSSTTASAQYYVTIDEMKAKTAELSDRELRVSGAVIGNSITYDPQTLTLRFTVAHVPGDLDEIEKQGGLAEVLHAAVSDPSRNKLEVMYNGPRPDLLKNEAQAIMTGHLDTNGVFIAEELLLKCPTRYDEVKPETNGAAQPGG